MDKLPIDQVLFLRASLAKHEHRVRVLSWGCLLGLALLILLTLLGRTEAANDRWEGKAISLRDDSGKVRATLDIRNDIPALVLYDRKGKGRLEMRLTPVEGDPGILLYDETGKERARLELVAFSSFLVFSSEKGEEYVTLALRHNDTSYLRLFSGEGKEFWKAP